MEIGGWMNAKTHIYLKTSQMNAACCVRVELCVCAFDLNAWLGNSNRFCMRGPIGIVA